MRLHLAEESRQFVPLPEMEAALEYWREVNRLDNAWATFEAVNYPIGLVIRVDVGVTYHKGTDKEWKERATKTRTFFYSDGRVRFIDSPNL